MLKLLKFLKGSAILYAILAPLFMMLEVAMDLTLPTMLSNIVDIGIANGDIHYVLATGAKMMLFAFYRINRRCGVFDLFNDGRC